MADVTYHGSYENSGPTGLVSYRGATYAGLWRTWHLKTSEQIAEAASVAWLGHPEYSIQHQIDWGDLADVNPLSDTSVDGVTTPRAGAGKLQAIAPEHADPTTAAGRQLLGAGHTWADIPPPLLSDHAPDPAQIGGGGPVGLEDYNGTDPHQHNADWGDIGERRSGHWQAERGVGRSPSQDDTFVGSDDVNYPATAHQADRGEIASKQRRMPVRMQASDEKDTTEGYRFAPPKLGGSDAQLLYAHYASPEMNAPDISHERGVEGDRAAHPALSFNTNSDHISTRNLRWVERRIPGVHFWRHDMRPAFWRLAKSASVTAPGVTHQTSPFPAGPGLSRTTVMTQPVIRRTPPPWDETAATDGSYLDSNTVDTSGMWSGFGGM